MKSGLLILSLSKCGFSAFIWNTYKLLKRVSQDPVHFSGMTLKIHFIEKKKRSPSEDNISN